MLEVFGIGRDGSARYRIELLRDLSIDDTFVKVQCGDVTSIMYIFDEAQRPQVESLVQAVTGARQR